MMPEITIKISFAREVGEVSTARSVWNAAETEFVPPEIPGESDMDNIPPPPMPEEFSRDTSMAVDIPPLPTTGGEAEVDSSNIPPPG